MIISYPSITQFQQLVELKDYREPTKKEYVRYVRKLFPILKGFHHAAQGWTAMGNGEAVLPWADSRIANQP